MSESAGCLTVFLGFVTIGIAAAEGGESVYFGEEILIVLSKEFNHSQFR